MPDQKILVVDDSKIVCAAVEREFEQHGYHADSALSGDQALEKARTQKYDLIFIDMVMPGMDGIQTCKALKEISPHSQLVFMTGKIDEDLTEKELAFVRSGGGVYFLYKPFFVGEIVKTAEKILSESGKPA